MPQRISGVGLGGRVLPVVTRTPSTPTGGGERRNRRGQTCSAAIVIRRMPRLLSFASIADRRLPRPLDSRQRRRKLRWQAKASEGKRVLSLVVGAVVFYVCLAIVSVVTDWELQSDRSVSGFYIGSWFLGAGLSSAFGVEMAKRVAANFNRIGLILLMVAPLACIAIGIFFAAGHFSSKTIVVVLCALTGSAVGLGVTFRDLMKS
jgi:hypothetical protein